MSVFSLQRYTMHNYKHRHVPSGLYVNDFNQFNKNNIKMSLLRQKHIDSTIKEKKERQSKLHMPKMLYSNVFLDNIETHPMNGNEFYGVDVCGGNNTTTNAMNKDKMKIETAASYQQTEINKSTSHVQHQMNLFDDLLDCVDNLEIASPIEGDNHTRTNINLYKANITTRNANVNATEQEVQTNEEHNINININNNHNNVHTSTATNTKLPNVSTVPLKIAKTTDITDDSVIKKINKQYQSFKHPVKFGGYHKYKFTKDGVHYPAKLSQSNNGLPSYSGITDDSKELMYFHYRNKISNPSKIYNDIGSFNEKFNVELARISRTYGKEESKGRFVENPLLKSYRDSIPLYDLYKDIKFIENRYTDNKRFKFKLLPLVNAKLRNFDRLGERIYQNSISYRSKGKLCIDLTSKAKHK